MMGGDERGIVGGQEEIGEVAAVCQYGQTIAQRRKEGGNPIQSVLDHSDQYYYNTETHTYNLIDGGKGAIKNRAKLSREEFALKDTSNTNARRHGVHEIKVRHDTLPEKQQRKLKKLEEERRRARKQKKAIEDTLKKGGDTIDGQSYNRIKDVKAWKEADHDLKKISEKLGEHAANAAINQQLPNAKKLHSDTPGDGKQGQFDSVYQDGDKIYIIEAKGAGGRRTTRNNSKGDPVEQGTEEYRDEIIENMEKEAKKDPELRKTVRALKKAVKQGKLEYLEIVQKANDDDVIPHVQISKYE
ncbi:hypothetical protein FKG94_06360 [Exilibacterium tricleocarpae]|uniref:Uncharacterized protein n=1 Tax=Exilibacterium tricleocarpae TaxID=2591008 RepID=A0A545U4A3_9GAMM|nr:hypothetical protein [Exilibacterium tricleocarpae]TQV84276.1 hypothetical protein FKG94_06360 [Exilibacterium tricleocarpae]